jgi:hypothetical protein
MGIQLQSRRDRLAEPSPGLSGEPNKLALAMTKLTKVLLASVALSEVMLGGAR